MKKGTPQTQQPDENLNPEKVSTKSRPSAPLTIPMGCPDPKQRRKLVSPQRRKLFVACLMLAAVVSTHSLAAQQGTRQYQLLRKPLLPQHPFSGNSTTEPLRHWN